MARPEKQWWTDAWNPVTGCTKISPGCDNCWAEGMAKQYKYSHKVQFHPERLERPLHWKKPRLIFVCNLGDILHGDVMQEWIGDIFDTIDAAPRHTYLFLTKRTTTMAERLAEFLLLDRPNVFLGVSVEDQNHDYRISDLIATPAAKHFVNFGPLLGPIGKIPHLNKLKWVLCEGESGQNARPCHLDWVRDLRDQCLAAKVPFWFKQWGPKKAGLILDGRKHLDCPAELDRWLKETEQ